MTRLMARGVPEAVLLGLVVLAWALRRLGDWLNDGGDPMEKGWQW